MTKNQKPNFILEDTPEFVTSGSGVYCLWSEILQKVLYVGATKNLIRRKNYYAHILKRDKRTTVLLRKHEQKFGSEDLHFTVLLHCCESQLDNLEEEYILLYKTHTQFGGYNRRIIASSNLGINMPNPPVNKGVPMSEEQKRLSSETAKRVLSNPETRAKMSVAKKGKPPHNKGIKTGKTSHNSKELIAECLSTGEVKTFASVRMGALALNMKPATVWATCIRTNNICRGYKFSIKSEVNSNPNNN